MGSYYRIICFLLLIFFLKSSESVNTVEVPHGVVIGKSLFSYSGKEFTAFQGIPYAKPPVGDLRFRDPEPLESWGPSLDATKEANVCVQMNEKGYEGNEDCLYINVYTVLDGVKRPVMVWIHGGGYYCGSGNVDMFDPEFIMDEDVVFITLNYRLGVLGFLSTEDKAAPGNYGLKDQVAALKWVREYIRYFEGDEDNVTVFGGSAGAASAHFHLISPLSHGLFHRAILQSGAGSCSWSVKTNSKTDALKLGNFLKCPSESSERLINCVREKDVGSVVLAELSLVDTENLNGRLLFGPVLEESSEKAFLSVSPRDVESYRVMKNVPVIMGFNNNEGIFLSIAFLLKNPSMLKKLETDLDFYLPKFLGYESNPYRQEITNKLKAYYFDSDPCYENLDSASRNLVKKIAPLLGEFSFDSCITETAKNMSLVSPNVYLYYFTFAGSSIASSMFGEEVDGVAHGDELRFLFNVTRFTMPPYTESEIKKTKEVVKLWTDFAKYGNPTPETSDLGVKWLPFSAKDTNFLVIGSDLKKLKDLFSDNKLNFWKEMNELMTPRTIRDEL